MLRLALIVALLIFATAQDTKEKESVKQSIYSSQTSETDSYKGAMRKAGICRWWLLVHDLNDEAFKPKNRIDSDFRHRMNFACPEARDTFIGPMDREYFEDRKRWVKEYGRYRPVNFGHFKH